MTMNEPVRDWVDDDYLFDEHGDRFRVDEYDFEYDEEDEKNYPIWAGEEACFIVIEQNDSDKKDELPDYGKNCETWAIAVDRNETKALIDDNWQSLE